MKMLFIAPFAVCGMATIAWAAEKSPAPPDGRHIGAQAVPTGYVRIYRDGNFEGQPSSEANPAYYNAPRFDGKHSPARSYCYAILFENGPVHVNWNDRVSSIVLYTNHTVTFYEHENFNRDQAGWSATLYPEYNAAKGYWESTFSLQRLRAGFGMKNDTISSFKYEHVYEDCL